MKIIFISLLLSLSFGSLGSDKSCYSILEKIESLKDRKRMIWDSDLIKAAFGELFRKHDNPSALTREILIKSSDEQANKILTNFLKREIKSQALLKAAIRDSGKKTWEDVQSHYGLSIGVKRTTSWTKESLKEAFEFILNNHSDPNSITMSVLKRNVNAEAKELLGKFLGQEFSTTVLTKASRDIFGTENWDFVKKELHLLGESEPTTEVLKIVSIILNEKLESSPKNIELVKSLSANGSQKKEVINTLKRTRPFFYIKNFTKGRSLFKAGFEFNARKKKITLDEYSDFLSFVYQYHPRPYELNFTMIFDTPDEDMIRLSNYYFKRQSGRSVLQSFKQAKDSTFTYKEALEKAMLFVSPERKVVNINAFSSVKWDDVLSKTNTSEENLSLVVERSKDIFGVSLDYDYAVKLIKTTNYDVYLRYLLKDDFERRYPREFLIGLKRSFYMKLYNEVKREESVIDYDTAFSFNYRSNRAMFKSLVEEKLGKSVSRDQIKILIPKVFNSDQLVYFNIKSSKLLEESVVKKAKELIKSKENPYILFTKLYDFTKRIVSSHHFNTSEKFYNYLLSILGEDIKYFHYIKYNSYNTIIISERLKELGLPKSENIANNYFAFKEVVEETLGKKVSYVGVYSYIQKVIPKEEREFFKLRLKKSFLTPFIEEKLTEKLNDAYSKNTIEENNELLLQVLKKVISPNFKNSEYQLASWILELGLNFADFSISEHTENFARMLFERNNSRGAIIDEYAYDYYSSGAKVAIPIDSESNPETLMFNFSDFSNSHDWIEYYGIDDPVLRLIIRGIIDFNIRDMGLLSKGLLEKYTIHEVEDAFSLLVKDRELSEALTRIL